MHLNIIYTTAAGTPLQMDNGWVPYGAPYILPSYSKWGTMVLLEGLAANGNHGKIGTLPEGYGPAKKMSFNVNKHDQNCQVVVNPDGVIEWASGSTAYNWVSLANIAFFTAGTQSHPLQLSGDWVAGDPSFDTPCFYIHEGMVFLSGKARYPSNNGWDEIARLPPHLAPRTRLVFNIQHEGGAGRVELEADGRLRWLNNPNPSTGDWISLNGVFFYSEDAVRVLPLELGEPETESKQLYDMHIGDTDPVEFYSPLVKIRCPKLMQENVRERIAELPQPTRKCLARYIHDGNCQFGDASGDDVFALLERKDMLNVDELHKQCEFWVHTTMQRDPWVILRLVLTHQVDLKAKVFTFLALNRHLIGAAPSKAVRENTGNKDCGSDFGDFMFDVSQDANKLKSLADTHLVEPVLHPEAFEEDMEKLFYQRRENGDCVILLGLEEQQRRGRRKGDDDEDKRPCVPAHKLILASRNAFFKGRLTSGIGNGNEIVLAGELEQAGFSKEALEALLFYLYTGRSGMVRKPKEALLLAGAADYHAISPNDTDQAKAVAHEFFLDVCQRTFRIALSTDNCIELLNLAWRMGDKQLVEKTLGFVVAHFKEIATTQEEALAALNPQLFHRIVIRKIIL